MSSAENHELTDAERQHFLETPHLAYYEPETRFANMARSTSKPHPVEVPNALDDSAYDLMSSSEISQASSDDGQTTSITSVDDQAADEVRSLSSEDEEEEDEENMQADDAADENMLIHRTPRDSMVASQSYAEGVDSMLTARALSEPSIPALSISETKFDLGHGNIDLVQTLLELDTATMPEQLKGVGFPFVSLSVGQYLASEHLRLQRPFRLLYIGDPSFKQHVVEKISAALHVSNGIVFDMTDEEVTDIDHIAKEGSHQTILSIDEGKRWLKMGEEFGIASTGHSSTQESLPDLAVFCHTNENFLRDPDPVYSSRARVDFAHQALTKQGIPTLHTTVANPLDGFDRHHIHPRYFRFVLDGRMGSDGDSDRVCDPYPVSIDYFLNMNVFILNKHLAYLVSAPEPRKRTLLESIGTSLVRGPKNAKALWARSTVDQRLQAFGTFIMVFFFLISMVTLLPQSLFSTSFPYSLTEPLRQDTHFPPLVSAPTTQSTVTTPIPTSAATSLTPPSKSLGKPLLDVVTPSTECANETVAIELDDQQHLIFTPPDCWTKLRRPPVLNIKISQGQWNVKVNVPKKHKGPYTFLLEDLAKTDVVNVTVWTTSKPILNQTTEISLGRPWLGSEWILQATTHVKSFGVNTTSALILANEYKEAVSKWVDSAVARGDLTMLSNKTAAIKERIFASGGQSIIIAAEARVGQARRNADRLVKSVKVIKDFVINKTVELTKSEERTRRPCAKAQKGGKSWRKAARRDR